MTQYRALDIDENYLSKRPKTYDCYNYYNALFPQKTPIKYDVPFNREEEEVNINFAIQRITELTDTKSKSARAEHIEKLQWMARRIFMVNSLNFPAEKGKQLYDLSLDRPLNAEENDIVTSIGGRPALVGAITQYPEMYFAPGVFALYQAQCLNPKNFKKLYPLGIDAACVSIILEKLQEAGILRQDTFDFLFKYMSKGDTLLKIRLGIETLAQHRILNQTYFKHIVLAREKAENVALSLTVLNKFQLINKENEQIIFDNISLIAADLETCFQEMETADQLELKALCQWDGPAMLSRLIPSLNQMFAYGISLLDRSKEEGKQAMILALSLKRDIKAFYERPAIERTPQLRNELAQGMGQQIRDIGNTMVTDRETWQVILANTLIACTGLGLFIVIGNLIVNRHGLFAKTKPDFMEGLKEDKILSCIK